MDNLWTRRSNSSKLSLSTPSTANGAPASNNDHPTRGYSLSRRHGDSSSHSNKNPFNSMSPSTTSIASPTAGASSAFGLGSGAFASFGAPSKTPKTPGAVLDFGSLVGSSAKTPTVEKQVKDLPVTKASGPQVPRASSTSVSDPKTLASSPAHPLRHSWVFWFRPPINKANGFMEYEKTISKMASFSSVEEFFTIYQHLKRPSTLPLVSDYHIFKKGVRPIWEDEENKKGGKWIVRLKKGVADRYWEDLLLAIIGDQFADASEEVCGAVLSVRSGEDILSIWARQDGGKVLQIRNIMKRVLDFPQDTKLEWKSHDSSIQQRTALDDARKDKSNQHNRNGNNNSREENSASSTSDQKQNS